MNVLITGASKGLGRELALAFAREGNDLIINGRNEKRLKDVESEIKNRGATTLAVIGNLIDGIKTLNKLFDFAILGKLDVLVNNAGLYYSGEIPPMDADYAEDMILTNLVVPILLAGTIYDKVFLQKGHGLIVNINSLAGKTFNDQEAVYCASKWGLRGFMGSFKHEARRHNVGVLDVYLGAMKTDMTKGRADWDQLIDPEEAAKVIVGLCENYKTLRINEVEIGRA